MKRFKLLSVVAATAFVASGLALSGSAAAAGLASKDKSFLEKANEAGMLEISASQLADQRSSNPEVKEFARMMVSDHTKVADELKTLASSKQVDLPATPTKSVQSKLDKLGKKSGDDFDKAYADEIGVSAHQDAVKLFNGEAKDAKDADIKAFAAKNAPALQMHLDKGKALKDSMKKKKS